MKKINPFKIYSLAILYLSMPKSIRHRFYIKKTPVESLAIGVVMTKIVYWKLFINNSRTKRKTFHFSADSPAKGSSDS